MTVSEHEWGAITRAFTHRKALQTGTPGDGGLAREAPFSAQEEAPAKGWGLLSDNCTPHPAGLGAQDMKAAPARLQRQNGWTPRHQIMVH